MYHAAHFHCRCSPQDEDRVTQELARHNIAEFYVLNPGGGWRSKCWPPERYGELHRQLAAQHGWRGVVSFGPRRGKAWRKRSYPPPG